MNLNFYIRRNEPSKKGLRIEAVITWQNNRLVYPTGLHAPSAQRWDEKKQRLTHDRPLSANTIQVNNALASLDKIITHFFAENTVPGKENLKAHLDTATGREKKTPEHIDRSSFVAFIDAYLAERRRSPAYKRGTDKVLLTCRNHLVNYFPGLQYDKVTWAFRRKFEHDLYTEGLSINYVAKMLEVVRQFIREAVRQGLMNTTIHHDKAWSVKKTPVKNFYYTLDELATIYHTPITGMDERVRDLFLIGAYSGLRFSDFSRIRPEHVTGDTLTIRMQKTGHEVVIPLHPVLRALLEKYEYKVRGMANQVFNRHIKEVCRMAGLTDKVIQITTAGGRVLETVREKWEITSSHTARRSFATNFYQLGVPAMYIMKITGHKTERQFMQYICLDGEDNARAMAKIIVEKMNFKLKAI